MLLQRWREGGRGGGAPGVVLCSVYLPPPAGPTHTQQYEDHSPYKDTGVDLVCHRNGNISTCFAGCGPGQATSGMSASTGTKHYWRSVIEIVEIVTQI